MCHPTGFRHRNSASSCRVHSCPLRRSSALITLSEQALARGLKASLGFASLGINMRLAVNIPASALAKVPITEIVETFRRSQFEKWPGAVIDVPEEQIIPELALADEMAKKSCVPSTSILRSTILAAAIPRWRGPRRCRSPKRKIDRVFVDDCGSDKGNARLCKTVIDLAHSFGRIAVGVGIQKASDALALVGMGCDHGQGFSCSVSRCRRSAWSRCCVNARPRKARSSPPGSQPAIAPASNGALERTVCRPSTLRRLQCVQASRRG